jgi:pyridoxal phosphate enzyme (YggS family)
MNSIPPSEEAQRLSEVRARIEAASQRAGRDTDSVTLIGASKTVEPARLLKYLQAGLRDAGENYIAEGSAKIHELGRHAVPEAPEPTRWHFIGALQSNKARAALDFDVLHSLDRLSLARALERELELANRRLQVLVQVNIGGEASKSGCEPAQLPELFKACRDMEHLDVVGLMTIGPVRPSAEAARVDFVELRQLRDGLQQKFGEEAADCTHLSMGMSSDFEVAIEEGATMVRLGTVLFGARAPRG